MPNLQLSKYLSSYIITNITKLSAELTFSDLVRKGICSYCKSLKKKCELLSQPEAVFKINQQISLIEELEVVQV